MADIYDRDDPVVHRNSSLWRHWWRTGCIRKICASGCAPELFWWLLWPRPFMCRVCWKKSQQRYTCTICGLVREQGNMPPQYLCTSCLHQLHGVGLHGHAHWKHPDHKSKWTPLSDEDRARLVVRKCDYSTHNVGCKCSGSGVIIGRKSDLDVIVEAIG